MKRYGLSVRAIIENDCGQSLLLRRSGANRHFVGCWEWPGGKVMDGEDFAGALVREVREETGLEIEITALAGAAAFEVSAVHVVLLCMRARVRGGVIHLSGEHDAYEWVEPHRLGGRRLSGGLAEFIREFAGPEQE